MKKDDDDETNQYTSLDCTEKFDIGIFENVPISCPNFCLVNLNPKKFVIQDSKREAVFSLESSMWQGKSFEEQRCDRAASLFCVRPRMVI